MVVHIPVLVHTPAHAGIGPVLTYTAEESLPPGSLVRVPLGSRETVGIVWNVQSPVDGVGADPSMLGAPALRPIAGLLEGVIPLCPAWCQLLSFAAQYYQRSMGEVAIAALPLQLRDLTAQQLARRLAANAKQPAQGPMQPVTRLAKNPPR